MTLSAPAACPMDFGREFRSAHREFPSQIKAMCLGRSRRIGLCVDCAVEGVSEVLWGRGCSINNELASFCVFPLRSFEKGLIRWARKIKLARECLLLGSGLTAFQFVILGFVLSRKKGNVLDESRCFLQWCGGANPVCGVGRTIGDDADESADVVMRQTTLANRVIVGVLM